MNAPAKTVTVGWKLSSLDPDMASVRYRGLLPALALEGLGVRSRAFSSGLESHLDGLDVLVIVKSFRPDDLLLAQAASARGIHVVYDLCDNIFVEKYAARSGPSPAEMFRNIAAHANCVVTTTEPLAAEIRRNVPNVPVVVIPDGIETPAVRKALPAFTREAVGRERAHRFEVLQRKLRTVARQVRHEGVRSIPPLLRSVVAHAKTAALGRLRRRLSRRTTAAPRGAAPAPVPQARTTRAIVWFGNHGAPHANFGILDILQWREALERVAEEFDTELIVISNKREKYENHIRPLAIRSRYFDWSPGVVRAWLKQAAVVIVPNTNDAFSICKSANRTVLALEQGTPVVATPTPALEPLSAFVHTRDPLLGLHHYLRHPGKGKEDAHQGFRLAEALYGQGSLGRAWLQLLQDMPARRDEEEGNVYLAVAMHLTQDLDLALPIMRAAQAAGLPLEAWCSTTVFRKSPRVLAALRAEQIPFRVLPEDSQYVRFPRSMRVLLTVAETNLNPHRFTRQLTEAAARAGVRSATLQHGFENVGLTYEDETQSLAHVNIAAHRIYLWGPMRTLLPQVPAGVRARCMPIGCPKEARLPPADLGDLLPRDRVVVGIFENLHWHRYSDAYRKSFIENVLELARAHPRVCFLLKPHHAGMWLTKRYRGERPRSDNLVIADPQRPEWEQHTAATLLGLMSAVITTPSTVALDAARYGLPVAVVANGLELDNYLPLPLLTADAQWHGFVDAALDPDGRDDLLAQSTAFLDANVIPGDAAARIVRDLCEAPPAEQPRDVSGHDDDETIRVFVGADRSQMLAVSVLEHSIRRHTTAKVEVIPMLDLPVPTPRDPRNGQRTGFSFSRFCIPKLAGYSGKAIYMDADMLVFEDIRELWNIPFDGAKVVIQQEVKHQELTTGTAGAPSRRIKQCAVMLLDCARLDWDIEEIVAGMDAGDYDYDGLMYDLCILDEGHVKYGVPFEWNSLEHYDRGTRLIHYTDVYTQPWTAVGNKWGQLWFDEVRLMLQDGSLAEEALANEIALGYFRPSLMRDVKIGHRVPRFLRAMFDARSRMLDKVSQYVPHKAVYEAKRARQAAIKAYLASQQQDQEQEQASAAVN